jgi:hypothetical protein
MYRMIILILIFLLTGCDEQTNTFYSYGLDNSCYKSDKSEKCSIYKPYDILNITVNKQNNTVTYQLIGIGLDDSNTIFKTLNDCSVLDTNNFSCTDFVSIDGKISNSAILGDRIISSNWFMYQFTSLTKIGINKSKINFINNNEWVTTLATIFAILFIIGTLGG